ncbi:MAG: tetratricopeptide repeat protein [Candidatus Pacebacteria bacterium]|nr:tetratricopeptide repeat protein [Candidatus Paceibacterota bacterium]
MGIYLVAVIIIAFYCLAETKNALFKCLVYLLIAATLILLAVIDFVPAWIILAISLLIASVLMFVVQRKINNTARNNSLVAPILIILISLAFIATSLTFINKDVQSNFASSSISSSIQKRIVDDDNGFAKEITLDKKTAVFVAIEGIKKDPISGVIGTGPGTYLYNFSKFKPAEFNNSIFWSIRFDKAGSEIIEKISTIGIVGTLSYLLIIVLTIGMFLKMLYGRRHNAAAEEAELPIGSSASVDYLFSAWFSLLLFQFLYLESTTIKFVFWMLTIILAAEYVRTRKEDCFVLDLKKEKVSFYSSLLVLMVLAVSLFASYYYQVRFYQAEAVYKNTMFAYNESVRDASLTMEGAWNVLDESVENLKGAIEKNSYNGSYKFYLSDLYFNRLAIVIQEENEILRQVQDDKQRDNQRIAQEMKNMIDYAKSAADENPNNIIFQQRLGNIYAYMAGNIEIADADERAIKKYNKAISLEPTNPILRTELGKVYAFQYLESASEDRIDAAISEFEKALELKNNYTDAGLQLGLAYEIKGDNEKAINQLKALLDTGAASIDSAFQLGRIYHNSGNINEAKNIFLEITRFQPRNANVRYSLGLIYEKEENYEEALREFEAVLFLNPDN